MRVDWQLAPSPASVGPATLSLHLRDAAGRPIERARLRLEGQMTHPGMAPVIVDLLEGAAGQYEAAFTFSMGGDWVLLLSGDLPDGRHLRREIEVPGVRASR